MAHRRFTSWGMVLLLMGVGAATAAAADTRLVEAVSARDSAAVKALIDKHADVNGALADGTTALLVAAQMGDVPVGEALIKAGANVESANRYGATPLWAAASNGNAAMVEKLLAAGANPNKAALQGEPPLLAAARAGSLEAVKALLAKGADANATEAYRGQTALMWAVGGHEPHADVAKLLLEGGADANVRSKGGFTALLFASRQGDMESVRVLMDHGAQTDPPKTTSAVLTAINNGFFDIARYLVEKGANANGNVGGVVESESKVAGGPPTGGGFTPLHRLVIRRAQLRSESSTAVNEGGDSLALMKALLDHGANPNAKTPKVPPKPIDREPSARPDIDEIEPSFVTPLWFAASAADVAAMKLLVAAGADPKLAAQDGTTPLIVAAGLGQAYRGAGLARNRNSQAEAVEAVKLLLEWGNDINAANKHGQTPLHGAADGVNVQVLQFLLDHGAKVDAKDEIGRTAYRIVDDHRTDIYRSNQNLLPANIEASWQLLRKVNGEKVSQQ